MRTIVRAFLLGLSLMSFHAAVFSQQVAKKISYPASPEGIIGFLEFRPSDYGSQKHPLIIFLHGIGERGNGTSQINAVTANAIPNLCARGASMRFTVGGQTSSFVVLSPQLSTQYGYWPTFYVKEMINYAKANLQIDPDRIYITGLSLGGGGVWRVITETQNWDYSFDAGIAAVAPVCGTQEENDYDFCNTIGANHLPIWAFHSMDDGTVGVGATQHAEILAKNCGVTPAPIFTYYQSGGHGGAWINAYDTGHITRTININGLLSNFTASPNLYEWFLGQSRSAGKTSYTAPVANAGPAQSITLPLSVVTLSGSGTGTNGATINSYSWTKTSGPAGGVISLPLLNTTLVTGLVQGTYVFTLTVTDNHGLTSSSNVTITVNSLLNQAPVANAGNNGTVILPNNSLTLNGTASDPDGYITSYTWSKTSGPSSYTIVSPNSPSTVISYLEAGTYIFALKATDNAGASATSSVTITVNAASNQPPVAYAGSNTTITLPTNSVTLDASGSYDPDGSIALYWWVQENGPSTVYLPDASVAKPVLTNLIQGVYEFTLQVRDNAGEIAFSKVSITVNPAAAAPSLPVNQNPVSNAGGNVSITLPTNSVVADGTGSYDPDGSVVAYWWVQDKGPNTATIADQPAARTTIGNLIQGEYQFTLQVRDNAGVVSFSTKTITVYAAPPATTEQPIGYIKTSAGPGQACDDVSVSGRFPIYTSSIAKGSLVYLDAAHTQLFDGGWNWYSFTPVWGGPVTQAFAIYPNGGIDLITYCSGIVPAPPPVQQPAGNLLGYVKMSTGPNMACDDASASGRIALYGNSVAKGSIVYTDQAMTQKYDGGWNWYSFTPVLGGPVTQAFAIYPNGGIDLITYCSGTAPAPSAPPAPQPASNLLGYVKVATGPNMACDDASASGRIALYGKSIANGSAVYTDEAMTQKYDGGWNWYSFTPVLGGPVTQAFAIYPIGTIGMLTTCTSNARMMATQQQAATTETQPTTTTAAQPSLMAAGAFTSTAPAVKLSMYPNPVHNVASATIEFYSTDNSVKTIGVYNSNGVLKASYKWPVLKGNNKFSLNNVSGLTGGLYILDVRDNNNRSESKLKFIKL